MPQDGLRSAVYRSFVTCDDPKGVVQCGTIRRSKTGSGSHKMKHHKIESQHTSLASMIEREDMASKRGAQEFHSSSSSLQLLEVSRGAEKLNQMIGSWSEGRSGDVAKDLLKGALDLQESLVMLGKLQEASKCMARLKKEERSRSDRFMAENQNRNGGFQRHRVSVDGPSRDCIDQLREVIRDSFASQNLLPPNTRREGKAYFHQRSFGSDLEVPSTSSSQSSTTDRSNKFDSTVSSLSPAAPRAKGPSLIARLMGLEEIPSKPAQDTPNMEMAMKHQLTSQKVDSQKRTMEETRETAQLKRVSKGDSVKEFRPQSHHFLEARPRCRVVDDIAPIVLIKPMRAGSQDFESIEPRCWDEETLKSRLFLRQLKMKGEHSPEIGEHREKISSNRTLRKGDAEETASKRAGRELKKPDEMAVKTKGRVFNKLKASEQINQKQHKNVAIDKRVDKVQKVASTSRKPVEKEIVKSPSSRSQDQARVAKTRPGVSDNRSNMKKLGIPEKKNTSTPNPISKSTKQSIVHSSSRRTKNQALKEKAKKKPASAQTITLSPTTENDFVDKETIATFTNHLITKEEEADTSELQLVDKETIATFTDNLITPEEETDESELHMAEKETIATFIDHLTTEEEAHASELHSDITTFTDCHVTEEETDASELQIEEDCIASAVLNPEHERDTESAVEVLDDEGLNENITDHTSSRTRTKLEAFLLDSPSFMRHVEDLFDLNINFPLPLQALDINDCGVACAGLSLDCANELVKRRSLPDSRRIHPLLLTCTGNTRICISLDQLMEEVCYGIETLRSYTHTGSESLAVNNLYAALERDMWSSGVVNGTWDLGWRNGFSIDEAEQVVNDVEKLLLSQLIEEAFALVEI